MTIEERLPEFRKKYRYIFWEVDGNDENGGKYEYDKEQDLWLMYTRKNGKINYWYTMKFIRKFRNDKRFHRRNVLFANYAYTEYFYYVHILKTILTEQVTNVNIFYTKKQYN